MGKKISTSRKIKENNYRIEKYKMDKYGNTACVEVGCYLSNTTESNLNTLGSILRHLNGLASRKVAELKEYELDGLMFWNDIPDKLHTQGVGYCMVGCQFNIDGISHHLDELVYDVMKNAIIDIIESSKLVVVDK